MCTVYTVHPSLRCDLMNTTIYRFSPIRDAMKSDAFPLPPLSVEHVRQWQGGDSGMGKESQQTRPRPQWQGGDSGMGKESQRTRPRPQCSRVGCDNFVK